MKPFIQFALALLITGFLVGDAYGEDEVYYCSEIASNGFDPDEKSGSYKSTRFTAEKFKMKLDRTAKKIEIKGYDPEAVNATYTCTSPSAIINKPEWLSCVKNLYHFNFNSNNGRFVLALGFGYVAGDGDTFSVSYGKCDKF